jgi:rod shape-determining protein MreC
VVTSGDGGLIPPGLPVGVLVADGTSFRVALLADAGASQDVRIVDFKLPPEQPPAPSPNDLPASAAGLKPEPPPPPPAQQTTPLQAVPFGTAPNSAQQKPTVPTVTKPPAANATQQSVPPAVDGDNGDTQDQ